MEITNSSMEDIDQIFYLYQAATNYQKEKQVVPWPTFSRLMVEAEIEEKLQFKIVINNTIACVWAITFNDPFIWEEKDKDPSIYIHRIATNKNFKGFNMVKEIVSWAKKYATENNKKYIRLDTVGENKKLIEHYTNCGFTFLGLSKLTNTNQLPKHYHHATVSLFQIML